MKFFGVFLVFLSSNFYQIVDVNKCQADPIVANQIFELKLSQVNSSFNVQQIKTLKESWQDVVLPAIHIFYRVEESLKNDSDVSLMSRALGRGLEVYKSLGLIKNTEFQRLESAQPHQIVNLLAEMKSKLMDIATSEPLFVGHVISTRWSWFLYNQVKERARLATRTPGSSLNLFNELQTADATYKNLAESLGYAKNKVSQRLNSEDLHFVMETAGPVIILFMVGFLDLTDENVSTHLEKIKDSPKREMPLSSLWIQDPMWGSEKVAISKLFLTKFGDDKVREFLTSACEVHLSKDSLQ